jgi:small subunit ribosomal protein S6
LKYYELSYLINPELSEEEVKTLSEKVSTYIQEAKGILDMAEIPVKKRLGYPIKEKRTAYFIATKFHLEDGNLETLEKNLKAESQILRFIIVGLKPMKITGKIEKTTRAEEIKNNLKSDTVPKKVELKEIEKKLEEILGE